MDWAQRGTEPEDFADRIVQFSTGLIYWLHDSAKWAIFDEESMTWNIHKSTDVSCLYPIMRQLYEELPALEGKHYSRTIVTSPQGAPEPSEFETWYKLCKWTLTTVRGSKRVIQILRREPSIQQTAMEFTLNTKGNKEGSMVLADMMAFLNECTEPGTYYRVSRLRLYEEYVAWERRTFNTQYPKRFQKAFVRAMKQLRFEQKKNPLNGEYDWMGIRLRPSRDPRHPLYQTVTE